MRLNNWSKGSGIPMVFFAISIAALLAGAAAYAQVYKLPPAFGETVDELGPVTEPESRLDDTLDHYMPLSAHYAVSDAAYNVSANNSKFTGHADSHVSTGPTESDNDQDEMEKYTEMIDYVDSKSQPYFEQYIQELNYDRCRVEMDDQATVNLSYSSPLVNVSANESSPLVVVNCQTPQIDVRAESKLGKNLSFNITNLRFHELASITVKTMEEMERVSEDLEDSGKHYGDVTGTTASCSYDESTYANPEEEAKDEAYTNAKSDALDKILAFEEAIVQENHGYGGTDRGAEEVLKSATSSTAFCVFGYCLDKFWVDDISYDVFVKDNETSLSSSGNSTYQCGCDNYACNQDPDSEYYYVSLSDACRHNDETGVGVGSNPYDADCDAAGEYKNGGDCMNASTSPWHVVGSPTCDEEDFEHDGSGGCEVEEDDSISESTGGRPDPQCTNKVYSADSNFEYRYEKIDVQLNLTDDKFQIPTNDGFLNLFMNKRFIRNFEKP